MGVVFSEVKVLKGGYSILDDYTIMRLELYQCKKQYFPAN